MKIIRLDCIQDVKRPFDIYSNKIRCKKCNDVIESKTCHDFVTCICGTVSVDGGHDYLKRSFTNSPEEDYEELSEIVEEGQTTYPDCRNNGTNHVDTNL